MYSKNAPRKLTRKQNAEAGQTLVVAIIILAVLLILGIGFAAMLNQNIRNASNASERSKADDFASAGIQYAHGQLVNSIEGADWRPAKTQLSGVGDQTRDPDALYLRPGTGLAVAPDPAYPARTIIDRGGPDYLGGFSRVNFQRGRALLRVRYGPSEYASLTTPNGGFLKPGALRSSMIIESVGRPGVVESEKSDPTLQLTNAVKFRNYADAVELKSNIGQMAELEKGLGQSHKLFAVVSLGLTEFSRSIWNKFNDERPVDFGFPTSAGGGLFFQQVSPGITYRGNDVSIPTQMGDDASGAATVPGLGGGWVGVPGGGSLFSNSPLILNGNLAVALNSTLGEGILVNGSITPANTSTKLSLTESHYDSATDQWINTTTLLPSSSLDSTSSGFSTQKGLIRDKENQPDTAGFVRGVSRRDPPSFFSNDPQSGVNRYEALTRESGKINAAGDNTGAYGFGQGVYIDSPEHGNKSTAEQRVKGDPSSSLPNDWLNPNNALNSGRRRGWVGSYYIPLATFIELYPDGFRVTRDSNSSAPYFRDPVSGNERTDKTSVRYWVLHYTGMNAAKFGKTFIVDDMTSPGFNPQVDQDTWVGAAGSREFNGVVLTAGDLRVRGVIPTDVQMTVVSQGTVYVDGSITKGVVARRTDNGQPQLLTRPSMSLLMLAARDYVAVNTTTFFGPVNGESPREKIAADIPNTPRPVELDATHPSLTVQAQFLLDATRLADPTINPNNPSTWKPYAMTYKTPAALGTPVAMTSQFLMSSAADADGPTFASMKISPNLFSEAGAGPQLYDFPGRTLFFQGNTLFDSEDSNDADPFFPTPAPPAAPAPWDIPILGLASGGRNTYPNFQTTATPVFNADDPAYWLPYTFADRVMKPNLSGAKPNPEGAFNLSVQDPSTFNLRLDSVVGQQSQNFELARTAVSPFDVRIEASVYAEEGSFFVIPGQWFNPNPNDTRTRFEQKVTANGGNANAFDYGGSTELAKAQLERYQTFHVAKEAPFFAEPVDVRVTIIGALAENLPATMSQRTEWLKKWGYIPRQLAATGKSIPEQHAIGTDPAVAPNLVVVYDPILATASSTINPTMPVRTDTNGSVLPPLPHLPVSPTLSYFGETKP